MSRRHANALAIIEGACNPSGIALSIAEACKELRAEPDHPGTEYLIADPAIRLMVYQLAFICRSDDAYITKEYSILVKACEAGRDAQAAIDEKFPA